MGATSGPSAIARPSPGIIAVIAALILAAGCGSTPATPLPTAAPRESLPSRSSDAPCRSTLQAEIDAAVPGGTLNLQGCAYTGSATVDRPLTIIGGTLRVPAGSPGVTVGADDVTLDSLRLVGEQAGTYDFNEMGVVAWATPDLPIRRLTIRYSEISSFGGFGTYLRNVEDLRLEANDVHDIVYAGLMVLSGREGAIEGNTVRRIGMVGAEANENNAYGIALTTQGADEPATSDFVVARNVVEDVPTWHALDTHGGVRIVFRENTVRRSMRGIFVTTTSADHQPADIEIVDNQLLSPAPVETNLAAITLYRAQGVTITGNTAVGWGEQGFLRDFEERSTDVVVEANHVEP